MVRAIGNGNGSTVQSQQRFTPTRATQMLPLVRRIVADMVTLSSSIEAQREQLRGIDALGDTIEQPNYQDEVRDIRNSLSDDELRLRQCMSELSALGITPHLPIDGTIDFPASLNRRAVNLCWHPDDEVVSFWHETDEGVEQRKRIDDQKFGDSLN